MYGMHFPIKRSHTWDHVGIFMPYIDFFGICKDKSSEPNLHDFGFFRPADGFSGWRGFWSVNHGVIPDCLPRKKYKRRIQDEWETHQNDIMVKTFCVFVFLGIDQVLFQVVGL